MNPNLKNGIEILPDGGEINWDIRENGNAKIQVTCAHCRRTRFCWQGGINKMRRTSSRCKECDKLTRPLPTRRGKKHYIKSSSGYILTRLDIFTPEEQEILRPIAHFFKDWTPRIEQHRAVIALSIGRPLTEDEIVHHKNGNRADNRLENLQLLTKTTHHPGKDSMGGLELIKQQLTIQLNLIKENTANAIS